MGRSAHTVPSLADAANALDERPFADLAGADARSAGRRSRNGSRKLCFSPLHHRRIAADGCHAPSGPCRVDAGAVYAMGLARGLARLPVRRRLRRCHCGSDRNAPENASPRTHNLTALLAASIAGDVQGFLGNPYASILLGQDAARGRSEKTSSKVTGRRMPQGTWLAATFSP